MAAFSSSDVAKVNWVKCPKCGHRYYLGPQILLLKDIPSICPKCRHEYDPRPHIEPKVAASRLADRYY